MKQQLGVGPNLSAAVGPVSSAVHSPRQCALIHVEGTYEENLFTIHGKLAHERVHSGEETASPTVRIVRTMPLWCERLGLRGKADAVEFHPSGPYPVEYKVGHPHGVHAAHQLCAQALCLEEMLGTPVPRGAIYYHAARKREEIEFGSELRGRTEALVDAIREMLQAQKLPEAPNDARCPACSLLRACLPGVVGERARLRGLQGALFQVWDGERASGRENMGMDDHA